jgi:ribosomal protein S27E
MKVQIMERKNWEKVLRETEMENSMTYALKCTEKGHSTFIYTFSQPLISNGCLHCGYNVYPAVGW